MFDISWAELFLIGAVAVLVIGPEELPGIMRNLGRAVRRLQYLRFALTQQFEDFIKEAELEEMQKEARGRPEADTKEDMDEHGANAEK